MLRLLDWLDVKYLIGPIRSFWTGVAGFCLFALLAGQMLAGMADPERLVSRAPSPPLPEAEFSRAESLFSGQRSGNKPESFAEAQRCLAQAIYFEARSEPLAGWEAVADVVINRAVSRRYPASICGVVFQGDHRRHKCQFSFACDGLSDRPRNRRLWQRSLRVAGHKLTHFRTLPVTQLATHYHADYVDPYWTRDMVRLAKIGRHIFYTDGKSVGF